MSIYIPVKNVNDRSFITAGGRMTARRTQPLKLAKPLADRIAVVAGATRGAGRGIARALAEAGATVYCTGRSVPGRPSPYGRPETIDETADMIKAEGGVAIPVRVDHTVESEVRAFFERINREHGRLDVLANSVAGQDPMMAQWASFWQTDLTNGEAILRQALLSHVVTAKYAAPIMIRRRRGLIVEVTESDMLMAGGNVLVQAVKLSLKGLAVTMASDLRKHRVAAISITPGFLRSEMMLEHFGVTEANWRDAGKKDKNFLQSETPLFVGRAVAALAQDPNVLDRSGDLLSSWELGREYGLTDADGHRPDWGRTKMELPPSMETWFLDELQRHSNWMRSLSRRTDRYLALQTTQPERSRRKKTRQHAHR
jgi:NAD(P)-dependent dehydrogenase (short-subunit alcohol dehydrogenase family)